MTKVVQLSGTNDAAETRGGKVTGGASAITEMSAFLITLESQGIGILWYVVPKQGNTLAISVGWEIAGRNKPKRGDGNMEELGKETKRSNETVTMRRRHDWV